MLQLYRLVRGQLPESHTASSEGVVRQESAIHYTIVNYCEWNLFKAKRGILGQEGQFREELWLFHTAQVPESEAAFTDVDEMPHSF